MAEEPGPCLHARWALTAVRMYFIQECCFDVPTCHNAMHHTCIFRWLDNLVDVLEAGGDLKLEL